MVTAKEIVIEYLKKNGYAGLCNPDAGCGCEIEDICPGVGIDFDDCQPAYKTVCNREKCASDCCDGEDGGDCFTTEKPVPPVPLEVVEKSATPSRGE